MLGKLQWMTYTRPDTGFATKELARALTQPTTADQQELKHLPQVHQRNTTLQAARETNNQDTKQQKQHLAWHSGIRWQRLGRMGPNDKEVNDRVPDQSLWSNNPLRQQNTSNNCAEQRGGRTILYAINTGATEALTTHQQLPERSSQHEEDQHPRPHRFLKRKEHGNTNWVVKEGEAHWTQTLVHTTAGRTRSCEDNQDQHHQQSGRPNTLQQRRFCVTSVMFGPTPIITEQQATAQQQSHRS